MGIESMAEIDRAAYWIEDSRADVLVLRHSAGTRRTLTIAAMDELANRLGQLSSSDNPPVVILDIDIRHAELDELVQMCHGRPISDFSPWGKAIAAVHNYSLPVVAAISNQATAGGLELALACDLRIVAPNAVLGLPEIRMGIIPGGGGTQRLPRRIGLGSAALLIFSGRTVDGQEAYRLRLAEVVADKPLEFALELAATFAANGRLGLIAAKRALLAAEEKPLAEGLREEGRAFLSLISLPQTADRLQVWRSGAEHL